MLSTGKSILDDFKNVSPQNVIDFRNFIFQVVKYVKALKEFFKTHQL